MQFRQGSGRSSLRPDSHSGHGHTEATDIAVLKGDMTDDHKDRLEVWWFLLYGKGVVLY